MKKKLTFRAIVAAEANDNFLRLWEMAKTFGRLAKVTTQEQDRKLAYDRKNLYLSRLIQLCPSVKVTSDWRAKDASLLSVCFGEEKLHTKQQWLRCVADY